MLAKIRSLSRLDLDSFSQATKLKSMTNGKKLLIAIPFVFWIVWNLIVAGMASFNDAWENGFSPYGCRATGGIKFVCNTIPLGFQFPDTSTLFQLGNGIAILIFFGIAVSQGWFKTFFNFLSSLLAKSPSEINMAWEVRRIRRLLEFFYLLTWLGLVFGFLMWANS